MATENIVVENELGPEFDVGNIQANRIRLKLGDYLAIRPDGTMDVVIPTEIVDQTFDAVFSLTTADIHNNGAVVGLVDQTLETGWSRTANQVTYSDTPDKVIGHISVNASDTGASNYWSRPKLRVVRGGATIAVLDDLVMQANGTYDGDATITGSFIDKTPGTNPTYTFEWFDQENRTATLTPNAHSRIALSATKKVTVFRPTP